MYKNVRHDGVIAKLERHILDGHVNRRHALAELIEPSLDMENAKIRGKKKR